MNYIQQAIGNRFHTVIDRQDVLIAHTHGGRGIENADIAHVNSHLAAESSREECIGTLKIVGYLSLRSAIVIEQDGLRDRQLLFAVRHQHHSGYYLRGSRGGQGENALRGLYAREREGGNGMERCRGQHIAAYTEVVIAGSQHIVGQGEGVLSVRLRQGGVYLRQRVSTRSTAGIEPQRRGLEDTLPRKGERDRLERGGRRKTLCGDTEGGKAHRLLIGIQLGIHLRVVSHSLLNLHRLCLNATNRCHPSLAGIGVFELQADRQCPLRVRGSVGQMGIGTYKAIKLRGSMRETDCRYAARLRWIGYTQRIKYTIINLQVGIVRCTIGLNLHLLKLNTHGVARLRRFEDSGSKSTSRSGGGHAFRTLVIIVGQDLVGGYFHHLFPQLRHQDILCLKVQSGT